MSRVTFPTLYKPTAKGEVQEWEIYVTHKQKVPHIVTVYGIQGGKKQTASEPILEGKNKGRSNETTPYEQAVAEAEARWNKQISRKAYARTVGEAAAKRWAGPMLALDYQKRKQKIDWSTAFAQPKLDGFRLLARCDKDGVVLLSREFQELTALTDIKELLEETWKATELNEITFDGEAYCHGVPLNTISSACKRKSDLTKKIQFHVYDCVLTSHSFARRHEIVTSFISETDSDLIVPVTTVKARNEAELMSCQQHFVSEGYEGAMLRHSGAGYEAGKRANSLLKVKTFLDDEFEIVDWKMGRGKFAKVPVFTCKTKDNNLFEVVAPGDMESKADMGKDAASYVGKHMKIKYQYMTKTDAPVPFLPVAVGLRQGKE